MEAEGTPNIFTELLTDVQPAPESLERIYRGLGAATMEAEEARIRERFLDLAGKLVTINQIRGSA